MNFSVIDFADQCSSTVAYIAANNAIGSAIVIDSMLDDTDVTGCSGTDFADRIINYVHDNNLTVEWIVGTGDRAPSAARYIKSRVGGKICGHGEQAQTLIHRIVD